MQIPGRQFLYRALALSIPLLLSLWAKEGLPPDQARLFFETVTDIVLLSALLKLGVDVYLPSCDFFGGKVQVSRPYYLIYQLIGVVLVLAFIFGMSKGGSTLLIKFLVTAVCLQLLLAAEIGRIKHQFAAFYLFNAPVFYVAAAITLFTDGSTLFLLFGVIFIGFLIFNWKQLDLADRGVKVTEVVRGSILSLLLIFFSWKEPSTARFIEAELDLTNLAFYTRLKVIITFVFMLHYARAPNRVREIRSSQDDTPLREVVFAAVPSSLLWAVLSVCGLLVYVWLFDIENILLATLLFSSAIIFVCFGYLGAVLIASREWPNVMMSYITALLIYYGICSVMKYYQLTNLTVAVASLVSQCVLGYCLLRSVNRLIARSKQDPALS